MRHAMHSRQQLDTPGRVFFASGTRNFALMKPRGSLRLVDLSRIPGGTFFREVHVLARKWPAKITKMMWHGESS